MLLLALGLGFAYSRVRTGAENEHLTGRVSGPAMRSQALSNPMPRYPAASLARGIVGVAVAEVSVDTQGRMDSIRILEAPDAAIARSVGDALSRWRFATPEPVLGRPVKLTSRLAFYFVIDHGEGRVLNPPDAAALRGHK